CSLLLPAATGFLAKPVFGGSTFVANFVLWSPSGSFSPSASFRPLLHPWSLGVEEQYYLLFPPLCMFFYRRGSRPYLPAVLASLGLLSMAFNVVFAPRDSALTYFLPFSRAWELIFGALLAFVAARYRTILNQNNEPSLT